MPSPIRYRLDNGLTVVLEERRTAPVVAVQVWVKAGSADESAEESGLAHLHEHMLFKGTARRGLGQIARDVESRGGEINAWTSFDQTVYHVVLASAFLAEGLDILSDAVRAPTFDADELRREIEVVLEELKRSQDLPSRRLSRAMFETAYRAHPYRRPVLGVQDSVRAFSRERILAFFEKHYRPDNMVLVVAGAVDPRETQTLIERFFGGDWGRRGGPIPPRAPEPQQDDSRIVIVRHAVKESHFSLAFHIPEVRSPDIAALDLVATVFGQGEGSRLNLAMKLERAIATDVYTYAYTPKDPGLLVAGAALAPDQLREGFAAALDELRRLRDSGIEAWELAIAKALVEADLVYGRETVQGLARKLGFYESIAGSLEFEAAYYARIAALTAEEAAAAARRYLDPQRATIAVLEPEEGTLTEDEVRAMLAAPPRRLPIRRAPAAVAQEERKPATRRPAADARTRLDGLERVRLANGATVIVKREPGVPLVAVRAVYPGGLRFEDEATNGVTQLYARLMTRSTRRHRSTQLARAIDELAGSLHGAAGRNSLSLRSELLAKHFERGLALAAECLQEPAFEAGEIEQEREMLLQDIRSREDNAAAAAFDLFARTLFQVHPYRFDLLGEEASVSQLEQRHLLELKARALHPSNLTLAIVGEIDPDRAFAQVEQLLGAAAGDPPAPPTVRPEPAFDGPRRAFREAQRAQAHLLYGFPGTTVASPERFVLDVLSAVLSGQAGRLFVELRDKRSLAYSVSCFSVEGVDPGYFGVYLATSPEKVRAALDGIQEQLARLLDAPLPAEEIERAKRYLIGAHAIGLQKNGARAALIAYDEAYGVGPNAYLRYDDEIRSVSPERVLEVARQVIVPARSTLAVLGPKAADMGLAGGE